MKTLAGEALCLDNPDRPGNTFSHVTHYLVFLYQTSKAYNCLLNNSNKNMFQHHCFHCTNNFINYWVIFSNQEGI